MPHGTFIFVPEPAYGWYLASTAIALIISWSLHNLIAWTKNKAFMSRRLSLFYLGTMVLVQPYWAVEIYANFAYFNSIDATFYEKTRPLEALFRYDHKGGNMCIVSLRPVLANTLTYLVIPGGSLRHLISFG